jgi:hypothetical protein
MNNSIARRKPSTLNGLSSSSPMLDWYFYLLNTIWVSIMRMSIFLRPRGLGYLTVFLFLVNFGSLSMENWWLVTDEPIEFEE